jgi:MFS family permease
LLPGTVVGAALVVRLFDEWWSYLPAGVVADLHRDLDVSYAGAGWLLALLTIGALAGSPLALLADHVDRRRLAVTGALGVAACLVAYALAAPFWVLAVASAGAGTSSDLLVHAVEASLSEADDVRLDAMVALQHALSAIGDLAGPVLLAIGAATVLGWQGAFAITAAAMVLYAAYLATVPFARPLRAGDGWRAMLSDAVDIARRRDVWRLAAIEMLIAPLDEPFLAFVVARQATGGHADSTAQLLALAVMVGGIAGSLVVVRIGNGPTMLRVALGAMLAGTVVAAGRGAAVADAAAMLAVGAGMAVVWSDLHVRTLRAVPGRSATVSIVVGTIGSASALVPVLVGLIADRAGLGAGLVVYVAVAASLAVVGRPRRVPAPSDPSAAATVEAQ